MDEEMLARVKARVIEVCEKVGVRRSPDHHREGAAAARGDGGR